MRGLYIHIPFCKKKCAYCDFVSYPGGEEYFEAYTDELCREMRRYKGEKIDTVFVGGGTPSLLPVKCMEKLINNVYKTFSVSRECEITLESNPGTMQKEKPAELRNLGINRLSIGVQSFNDDELKRIGRIHSAAEAEETIIAARGAGFQNINIDIMFSLPGQTAGSLAETIEKTIMLLPEHVSCYSLILEEGTALYKEYAAGKLKPTGEEEDRRMYAYLCKKLNAAGYRQYEISNFAREGYECRHNLKYWDCTEYIGIGAAAHSYYGAERFYNTASIEKYLRGEYREGNAERITRTEAIKEFMIMGLRKTDGIEKAEFYRRFNEDIFTVFGDSLNKFLSGGFMEETREKIRFTPAGVNVSNTLLCEFV